MIAALLLALCAPLPPVKDRPPVLPGVEYRMAWRSADFDVTFYSSGVYVCRGSTGGGEWAGVWRCEGRTLTVGEARADALTGQPWPPEGGWPCRWSVTLDAGGRGALTVNGSAAGDMALTPRLPR